MTRSPASAAPCSRRDALARLAIGGLAACGGTLHAAPEEEEELPFEWEGYPVFMCPSPQRDRDPKTPEVPSTPKGFLVVRLKGKDLQVAHHHDSGWGETWTRDILLGK